jgi:purine-binding chemotaxis protein CheW
MPASLDREKVFPELSAEEINLLEQRAARYAEAPERQATDTTDAVVFRRGLAKYALPLVTLREVRPLRSYCLIPCASPSVPGILHFRGEIISLHDVAAFIDPTEGIGEPSWVIVVEYMGERIGLAADEILDVERHSAAKLRPLPITFGDRGIIADGLLPDGTLLLSAARMFHTDTFFSAF